MFPPITAVSQRWQTPERHDQETGTEHCSANSSKEPYLSSHRTVRLLFTNVMDGPECG